MAFISNDMQENLTIDSTVPDQDGTIDTVATLQEPKSSEATEQENLQLNPLYSYVKDRYDRSRIARRTDELRWLEAYRNYRGLYGPDVQFTATEKSRVFMKITKTKVLAAWAQLTEILFSGNKFPIGVEPSNNPLGIAESIHYDPQDQRDKEGEEQPSPETGDETSPLPPIMERPELQELLGNLKSLKDTIEPIEDKVKEGPGLTPTSFTWEPAQIAAKKMNRKIQDQLAECSADKSIRAAVFEQVLYGTGCIKGPFLEEKEYPKWDESGKYIPEKRIVGKSTDVSVWNIYPDPEGKVKEELEYVVQRHRFSRSQLRQLKKRPGFRKKSIDAAIFAGPAYVEEYWESTLRDDTQYPPNERYEVLEYWGMVDADLKEYLELKLPKEYDDLDEFQVNIWICNNQILRVVINPFTPARIPYFIFPYEINPYSIFGIGIAENMSDTQLLMNGFMRMAVDNGVLSSNIVFEVNENQLVPGQDMDIYPGKVFRTNGQIGQSIHAQKFPNITQEAMLLFDKARQLADEATGMPSYAHGMSGIMGVGRTAAGMSMLMGAAKENIKSVVRNIDDYLLVPWGKSYFAFNMQFDYDEEIVGDLAVVALGTESLMKNEVRSQKLLQFMQITNNPMDAPWVKRDYILRELAESLDLEPEKVVNDQREAGIQAEMIKQMKLAQGINPDEEAQMAQGQGNPAGSPSPQDPTQSGGGNIGPGAAPGPQEQGFSANTGASQTPQPPVG